MNWLAVGEVVLGALLISPADEIAFSSVTGGTGLAVAPFQAVGTGAVGFILLFDGLRRL